MNRVIEVANMMANEPNTKVSDVIKKFKVSKSYAYNLMSQARKKYINRRNEALKNRPKLRMESSEPAPAGSLNKVPSIVEEHFPITMEADPVNHPEHYKTGGIETIDFIEAKSLGYNLGNVVKYVTRSDHKGNKLQDLQKAAWYLNREIAHAQA